MSGPRPIDVFKQKMRQGPDPENLSIEEQRVKLEEYAKMLPPSEDVKATPIIINGVDCEWVRVTETREDHVIILVHGGGFVAGSITTHRGYAGELARSAKARTLSIEYSLAPEHPFPAGLNDVLAVYREIIKDRTIRNITLLGDSAGGGLVLSTLLCIRDEELPQVPTAVLHSPWVDLRNQANSHISRLEADPSVRPNVLRALTVEYLGDVDPLNPLASPVLAVLKGLPPILVQVGSDEVLLDDSLLLDRLGRKAGVDITLEVWPEMVHGFQAFYLMIPEGMDAIQRTGRYLRERWG